MHRDLLRLRFLLCLNLVIIVIVAAVAQAQAQPGSDSSSAAPGTPDTTNPKQRVVLKVGGLQITQAAFEQYVADLEAQQGPAEASPKQLGDNYASMLMLSRLADSNGLEKSPEVQRQLAIDRMQILSNAEFARLKTESAPTPEQISAYYKAHAEDYDVVEMRRLFVWASSSDADASKPGQGLTQQQADKLAEAVRQAFKSGADINRIQKLISDTPHGKDDVVIDVQPLVFQRGEMPAEMNDAAFGLQEGQWTELKRAPGSYVFLQVVKRSRKDLKAVTPQIEKKLQAQKLREELETLKKDNGVWLDETYFVSKPTLPVHDRD